MLSKLLQWIDASLTRKYLAGMAIGLIATVMVFSLLFAALYHERLREERVRASVEVNRLLQTSLENAMLKQDLSGLQDIVSGLGRQSGIAGVMILNPHGEVRFAAATPDIGKRLDAEKDHGCAACHLGQSDAIPSTLFFTDADGRDLLRGVTPVRNREPCTACHGPVEVSPINGVLVVDYDFATIRSRARESTLALMGAGSAVLLITLLGGWWFMGFFVLRPVRRLTAASNAVAAGRLETRVALQGRDELARLGTNFDGMAKSLQAMLSRIEEHEAFLQGLIDAVPDGVRVIGPDYQTIASNRAFRNQLGLDSAREPIGPCYRVSHARDEPCVPTLVTCPVYELERSDEPLKCLHYHQRADGSKVQVEVYAAPMLMMQGGQEVRLVVESIRDLDRHVRFSQQQKLADLGQLAAGVAHEIRNPLSSVHLALQSLLANIGDRERFEGYLKLVNAEIGKCIEVNDRLLSLAGAPSSTPQLVDLNTAVDETLSLLNFDSESRGIHLFRQLDEGRPRVVATDGEIRQVVLNLIQNAFHALPDGGNIEVTTKCAGPSVQLSVADDGPGIPVGDQDRIFQPFYSSRFDGSTGSGLGLPIIRSVVTRYGGRIDVASEPGTGATLTIILPNPDYD